VAQEVFAEKGYREATVEDICSRAKSNIAAINYHFGSKEELYAQVWRRAFDEANEAYPPEGGPFAVPFIRWSANWSIAGGSDTRANCCCAR